MRRWRQFHFRSLVLVLFSIICNVIETQISCLNFYIAYYLPSAVFHKETIMDTGKCHCVLGLKIEFGTLSYSTLVTFKWKNLCSTKIQKTSDIPFTKYCKILCEKQCTQLKYKLDISILERKNFPWWLVPEASCCLQLARPWCICFVLFAWPCLWVFFMGNTDYYVLSIYFTVQQSTRYILRDFDLVSHFMSSWSSLQSIRCAWHGPIRRLLVHDIGLKSQKMSSRFYRRGSISKARWWMRGKPSWRPDGGGRVVWEAKRLWVV